jgi:hypothetical protein
MAIVIGQRMSTDAMAVVIGVAVGVAASVPTSLLLVALLRKERSLSGGSGAFRQESPRDAQYGAYPPALPQQPNFIVLDPSQFGARNSQMNTPLPPPEYSPDGGMRRLRVVGSEDEWNGRGW